MYIVHCIPGEEQHPQLCVQFQILAEKERHFQINFCRKGKAHSNKFLLKRKGTFK